MQTSDMRAINLMSLIIISIFLFPCNSQKQTSVLTGDLYFGFFRFASYYNQSDSLIDRFRLYFDTLDYDNASIDDRHFIDLYRIVENNGLIKKPYIDILVQTDSIVKLYLDIDDYNRIKVYKRKDLQDNNKKIVISANVLDYSGGIYYCDSLISIDKVSGQTLQIEKKFRIDDYE